MNTQEVWQLDEAHRRLCHPTGLCLKIAGPIHDPEELFPILIPDSLGTRHLVALIREGAEFCRQQPTARQRSGAEVPVSYRKPKLKYKGHRGKPGASSDDVHCYR